MDTRAKTTQALGFAWSVLVGVVLTVALLWILPRTGAEAGITLGDVGHLPASPQTASTTKTGEGSSLALDQRIDRARDVEIVKASANSLMNRDPLPAEPHIRLEKNSDYYDAASVPITQVTGYLIGRDQAWDRYQSGEFDVIAAPLSVVHQITQGSVYSSHLTVYPNGCTYYYGFSVDVSPFDDPLVRAAFSSALDRQKLIDEALEGGGLPALTLTPPGEFGHVDGYAAEIGWPFSPTLALDLLAGSFYTYATLPEITLMYNFGSRHQAVAEAVRQQWIDNLGITVTLEAKDWGEYIDLLNNGPRDQVPGVWRLGWCADFPDAHNWHGDEHLMGGHKQRSQWDNPAYDAIVNLARVETSIPDRLALYEQAERYIVMTDTAILPLYFYADQDLTRPDVSRTHIGYGGQHMDEWDIIGDLRPLEVAGESPSTLDPKDVDVLGQNYAEQVFLGLTDVTVDGNVVAELASGWTASADLGVYTFTLRSDVRWTDGATVTAQHVKDAILRSLDPNQGSGAAFTLYILENAQDYNQGAINDPDLVGVEVVDNSTIRFDLAYPAAYWPSILSMPLTWPIPQWVIDEHGESWTNPENIVTNGPYRLVEWVSAPYLRVEKEAEGPVGESGNLTFRIRYYNDGPADAENVVITDTMDGLSYLSDTAPFSHSGGGTSVVWELGTVPGRSSGEFELYVEVTAVASNTVANTVEIATSNPFDQGYPWDKRYDWSEHVQENSTYLSVNKWGWTGDPAPDNDLVFSMDVCNTIHWGTTASSYALLTDTLNSELTLMDWWSDPDGYWTELARDSHQLVLGRPSVPGNWCGRVYLRTHVDPLASPGTVVSNQAVFQSSNNLEPNNSSLWEAQVGHPRLDLAIYKGAFPWYGTSLVPGGQMDYDLNYRNDGNVAVGTVRITDTLPVSSSFRSSVHHHTFGIEGIDPVLVTDEMVVWELPGLEAGQSGSIVLTVNIDEAAAPGAMLVNVVEISLLPYENNAANNAATYVETVQDHGPNLRAIKWHGWDGDGRLHYEVRFMNIGDEPVSNVRITDTYPVGTAFYGEWNVWGWSDIGFTDDQANHRLIWSIEYMDPGWHAEGWFNVDLDSPGERFRWYTNTIEITLPPDDANPADNIYTDVAFGGGEVDRVEINVREYGDSYLWGNAQPGTAVTVTAPAGQFTAWADLGCDGCWDVPNIGRLEPGDVVVVEAGLGRLPVAIPVPDPLDVWADSDTDQVGGRFGGLDHEMLVINLSGHGEVWVTTDDSGTFLATLPDVPRGGSGEVRYSLEIDHASVTFHRDFRTDDLPINANYGHDWVEGSYEPGHTVWITVTESDGSTVKGTATLPTGEVPWWGGGTGYSTNWHGWTGATPDMQAGDWVYGRVDNGKTNALQLGDIAGNLSAPLDAISGTILAPWIAEEVDIWCHTWGSPGGGAPGKGDRIRPDGVDSYSCSWDPESEWDVDYNQDVAVSYGEADGDQVFNVFSDGLPELHLSKWNTPGHARPDGLMVYGFYYRNNGSANAENVTVVDTLPPDVSYLENTGGFSADVAAGGVITWHLGTVDHGQEGAFMVTLQVGSVPTGSGQIAENCAVIDTMTPFDPDPGNNGACTGRFDVWENDVELHVNKWCDRQDPTPGQQYRCTIRWCNNRGAAAGPVWLTDTLPAYTTLLSWYPDNWAERYFVEVSSGGQLVLYAPGLPGNMCQNLNLELMLDPDAPISSDLTNRVVIAVADDVYLDNNQSAATMHAGPPRYDLHLDKRVHGSVPTPGGWVNYTISYHNRGNIETHVWVTDTVPAGISFQSVNWGGGLPQSGTPFPEATIIGDQLVWDLGTLPVGSAAWFHVQMNISDALSAGYTFTNCAVIGLDGPDANLSDNTDCVATTLNPNGPNLHVWKQYWWNGSGQLQYSFDFANLGNETISDVWITDTLPLDTHWNGWWSGISDWPQFDTLIDTGSALVWHFFDLYPGDWGNLHFQVDLDSPGERMRWYTNTIEITTPPGDIDPGDNSYTTVAFSGGEVERVEVWYDPIGAYHKIWGSAMPGVAVTVTTPHDQFLLYADPDCGGCWDSGQFGELYAGDVIVVEAGAGVIPITFQIPDPFTVAADSNAETVSGQIGGWLEQTVEIHGNWEYQQVQSDNAGNYLATFGDMPRGASGYIRFQEWVDYAQIMWHQPFWAPDLVLQVNYGHDWVEGNYAPGHTVWITVTESNGVTVKGTATLLTFYVPWWGGTAGFSTNWHGWTWQPDMQAGDWVYGRVDNGKTGVLQLGDISGNVSSPADAISGTVLAPWITQKVDVDCHAWGAPGGAPNKQDRIVPDGADVYSCAWDPGFEWDVDYEQEIGVSYREPDGDTVFNVFRDSLPELSLQKWNAGGHARPGGLYVYSLHYRNNGGLTAENVTIVDTLPTDLTYAGDTSGFPVEIGAGGVITWHLGSVGPYYEDVFFVTAQVPGSMPIGEGQIAHNCAVIDTTTPGDPDPFNNAACSGTADVWYDEVEIQVDTWCDPQDPTPGQRFNCTLQWCNNRGAAAGPAWLTDTLPANSTLLNWYPNDWWSPYWSEVSSDGGQLALFAPGLPGIGCQHLTLELLLDLSTPISTELHNSAVIAVADDVYLDNNLSTATMHASPPRYDLYLDKSVHRSVPVPGGWVNYFIWYQNRGNTETHVWVTDTVPAGLSYQSANWGGGQPQQNDPFPPATIVGDQLVWDLGTLPIGGSAWFHIQMNISDALSAGYTFTNCAVIGSDQPESTPDDNADCAAATLNPNGPNLTIWKQYWWNGEGQLQYEIYYANRGDETISGLWITDTLPLDTHWNGWWEYHWLDWNRFENLYYIGPELLWHFFELYPGDEGLLRFQVDLDSPGERMRWYTNTVEITTPPGDISPDDNSFTTVAFSGGEVDRVQVWYDPAGDNNNIWGDAQPGVAVTVTTPHGQFTAHADPGCGGCWGLGGVGQLDPGDLIVVEAGAGLMPVTFQVPDPLTAQADSAAETVFGQIGGWFNRTVELHGDLGYEETQTDNAGNFSATYGDVPRGANGYIRFVDWANYAEVIFHHPFWAPDLVLEVNYGHDWVHCAFEPGHTLWVTVTEGDGVAVKGVAQLQNGMVPWVDGQSGYHTAWEGWVGDQPDIQPGDWIFTASDNGATAEVQIGAVTGVVDSGSDSIAGTVDAAWIGEEEVVVQCHPWGAPGGTPGKQDMVWPNGSDPYTCAWNAFSEWDVQPMQQIAVFYHEPDGDSVGDVFVEYNLTIGVNYAHDWVNGDTKPGEVVDIVVADSGGTVKGTYQVTAGCAGGTHFNTGDGGCYDGYRPDILPGDRVTVTVPGLGWQRTINPVGEITAVLDVDADTVSATVHANWFADPLYVDAWVDSGPSRGFEGVDPDGGSLVWDLAADGWDLQPFQQVWVRYYEPDLDWVMNAYVEYDLSGIGVNYAEDWVNGKTEPGALVDIVIADDAGTVKGTYQVDGGCSGDTHFNTGDGNCWNRDRPDIVPGDRVTVTVPALGFQRSLTVGTITGELDVNADAIGGSIYAGWLPSPIDVGCGIWNDWGNTLQWYQIDPAGGRYDCDFAGIRDIVPGDWVGVQYTEPNGNHVLNMFQEPAPYLRLQMYPPSGEAGEGGSFLFDMQYWNQGTSDAENAVITATLQGMTYLDDTSGLPHAGTGAPGDPVVWQLGTVLPNTGGGFYFFVTVTSVESETVTNTARIATTTPFDQGSLEEKERWWSGHVHGPDTHLNVGKSSWTGDPAADTDLVFEVNVCNNGGTATTRLTVTDTLPAAVTFVNWWGQHPGWSELSNDGHTLVFGYPGLPGWWCSKIYLQVHVNAGLAPGFELYNHAVIAASNDMELDDNIATWYGYVNSPHTNLAVWKDWNSGQLVPGGEMWYSFARENWGNVPVDDVWMTATLPVSVTVAQFNHHDRDWNDLGPVPYVQTGDTLVWYVGTVANGEQVRYNLGLRIDGDVTPGTVLNPIIRISEKPGEDTYDDNLIQWLDIVNPAGPNLHVDKENHGWDGEDRLYYELRIKNLGTTRLENIWVIDTYPISTTWNGDWRPNHGPWITMTHDAPSRRLAFWLEALNPGETSSIQFRVDLNPDLWGVPEQYYTNTVEAPWPGDVFPDDNQHTVVDYSGPPVQLWVRVNQSHNWVHGEAPRHTLVVATVWRDGVPVMTDNRWTGDGTWWDFNFCCGWERQLRVGDVVEVQTSDGQSAVVEIVPMQGEVDSNANTISGQIEGVPFPAAVRAEVWGNVGEIWAEGATSITGTYLLDLSPFDLLPGHMVALSYLRPDGNQVSIVRHGLQLRVDVGLDTVAGETVPGVPVTVTVNGGETHTTLSDANGSFYLEFAADLVAGDLIEGWSGWGTQYTSLVVVPITAFADDEYDRVWGFGPPNDQVIVVANGDWRRTETDGSGFFEVLYEWDINSDTDLEVQYDYPEGHQVNHRFGRPDVSVGKRSDLWRVVPGDEFSFWIDISNNGNGRATGVVLTDTLPSALIYLGDSSVWPATFDEEANTVVWQVGTVAAYRGHQFELRVQLDPDADPNYWYFENLVQIAADDDRDPDNNESRSGIQSDYPQVDLWVDKGLQGGLAVAGEVITYRISYGNGATRPADGVLLTDTLPAGTSFVGTTFEGSYAVAAGQLLFDLGSIPAGHYGEFELGVRIDAGVAEGTLLANTLEIGSTPSEPSYNLRDNWRRYTVAVEPAAADLWVSKETWGDFSSIDNSFVYHITFGNSGNAAAQDVIIVDTLPDSVAHLWHSAGSAATVDGNVITWHLGTVSAGATGELLIGAQIGGPVPPGGFLVNTVVASTSTPELDQENNHAEDELGPPRVITVPWAGDRPHRVWPGLETTLKGTAKGHGLSWYEWDPGDGSEPIGGWVGDPYVIEAGHTYDGAVGDVYTATLTVWGAFGWFSSDIYVVQVYSQSQGVEVDVAVDEGLWYVHKSANRYDIAGYPAADWSCCGNQVAEIATAVQAFQIHGHLSNGDPLEDPYVEDVERGLNALLSFAVLDAMTVEPHGDPDTDGDGAGVGIYQSYNHSIYEAGLAMMALASTGTPDRVARTGPPLYVQGRTYHDIVQNMADWFAWGQNDYDWARGGWRYQPNSGDSDNSNTQFPVLGLAAAEENWGIVVPGWVKEELRDYWLPYTQRSDGGFGYTCPDDMTNVGKTGAGIMNLFWVGLPVTHTRIVSASDYIYTHWHDPMDDVNYGGNVGDFYAMYAVKKGSQLAQIDFYGPLTDTLFWQSEYDAYLIGAQQPDGRWAEDPSLGQWFGDGQPLATAWALLTLAPGLYEPLPVAIIPPVHQGWEGQPVVFDASLSHHTDPHRVIAWYQWEFGDGSPVISTTASIVNHTYAARGLYRARLTVWDDAGTSASRGTLAMITAPNNPPVADPAGPYLGRTGEAIVLDGSGSYDPDADLGDYVTQYVWDIQGGSVHTTTEATLPFSWTLPGTYQVSLVVRDRGADYGLDSPKWSDPVATTATIQEPVAGLAAFNDSPTILGNATNLAASVTAGSDLEWAWDLGDGTTGNSGWSMNLNIPHVYPQSGVYTAVFTVSNVVSSLSASTVVTVIDEAITGLTASNDGPTPLSLETLLTANVATGSNVVYTWDLGDWTFAAGRVVGHVYPAVGTYTAVVTASNSLSQVSAETVVVIERTADLSVAKLDQPDPVIVGHPLTYTLEVVNSGPFEATGVVLVDTLPEGVTYESDTGGCVLAVRTLTCNLGNLMPGADAVIRIHVTPTVIGTPANIAEVSGAEHDLDLTDNLARQETTVAPEFAPVVSRIIPNAGYNDEMTPVVVEGANFVQPMTVSLGSTPVLSVVLQSGSALIATVPAGMAPQTYDLVVSTAWGSSTLLGAFTVLQPTPPVVTSVVPGSGRVDLPTTIHIYGQNLANGATAELVAGGGRSVTADPIQVEGVLFIDSTHLRGTVPQGIPTGVYTLTVANPDRYSGSLPAAYEAFEVYDDLYASPGDLWLTPPTYHQGEPAPTVGLRVRRQGGIGDLVNVTVGFYLGDPAAGGTLIGTSIVPLLPPDGVAVTAITWQPRPSAGSYTIYAVIDDGNGIPETHEGNNTLSHAVTVLPPRPDTTPPTVHSLTINSGATSTSNQQVVLETVAVDNVGGSGIYMLHFKEFEWSQNDNDWALVAQTGWLPYPVVSTGYLWLLQPEPGVRYIQVWASDQAGNISSAPGEAFINYLPKTAYVAQGQGHVFRHFLTAGQSLRVRLTSITGDADLYVWDPAGGLVAYSWAFNPEDVTFVAGVTGVYQIEVEGWTAAYYKLEIIPVGGSRAPLASQSALQTIRQRPLPLVMPGDTPSQDVGLPAAPEAELNQYVEGLVFLDVNGDGAFDLGIDRPLAGAQVRITDTVNFTYTVTADANGYYSQTLPPGETTVDVLESSLPANVVLAAGSQDPNTVTVPENEHATVVTGYVYDQYVDGIVYLDVNADGAYTAGTDTLLVGVGVTITDTDGLAYQHVTSAAGYFKQTVPAGNTTVDVNNADLPANVALTTGSTDPTMVTVPVGGHANHDTGYVYAQYVDGTVFVDVDGDGVFAAAIDTPLDGVGVTITDVNARAYSVTTGANGYFRQTVPAGSTQVDVNDADLPANVSLTTGSSDPTTVNVPAGSHTTVNAGYVYNQYVDGIVYLDVNADGAYSAGVDRLLSGVDIIITDANALAYTVATDGNGYFVQSVPAGSTQLDVNNADLPANVVLATGSTDPTTVTVPAGSHATDNTGYVYNQYVDGIVYLDVNADGAYTAGTDTLLVGVGVTITDTDGLAYQPATSAAGYFKQTVPAGNTTVDVNNADLPANVALTTGSTDPTTVTVPAGGHATDNTGYFYGQYAEGTVYLDVDGDGVYAAGTDRLLDNVDVTITDSGSAQHTVTTDVNGYFRRNVPAGETWVKVDVMDLPPWVEPTIGSTDPTMLNVPPGGFATDITGFVYSQYVDGTVYTDVNRNGAYDVGIDEPLAGVHVAVTDEGEQIHIVTTDANGYFRRPLPAGDTVVDVNDADLPPGAKLTTGSTDPTPGSVPIQGHWTVNTGYVVGFKIYLPIVCRYPAG